MFEHTASGGRTRTSCAKRGPISRRGPAGAKARAAEVASLRALTDQGVRHLLGKRAYLGEATIPNGEKGKPTVIANGLIAPAEWEPGDGDDLAH
jgi:hypothetical protein